MPVEIKELIIRTNIVSDLNKTASEGALLGEKQKREIVDACVRKLQKLMKKESTR